MTDNEAIVCCRVDATNLWSTELTEKKNKDNQREHEEQAFRQMATTRNHLHGQRSVWDSRTMPKGNPSATWTASYNQPLAYLSRLVKNPATLKKLKIKI